MSPRAIPLGFLAVVLVGNVALPSLHGALARWKTYLAKPDEWYRGPEGTRVVANVLSYQSDQGSWPKNLDTTAGLYTGDRRLLQGTFDNEATIGELRFLARSYRATRNERFLEAFRRGLDHILAPGIPREAGPSFILQARAINDTSRSMMG